MEADGTPDFSVVIPVYNNAGSLDQLMQDLDEDLVGRFPGLRSEVIFVDDGSKDESFGHLMRLHEAEPARIRVIKLTRNFGQPSARLAGLRQARGRSVISMAADGQEPASVASEMLRRHIDEGAQVVIGARAGRDETWFRKISSRIFYSLMRRVSFNNMPRGGFSFVLLGRRALDTLLRNSDSRPFFQGQVLWLGYKPEIIEFHRPARIDGQSGWTLRKKINLLVDALVGYSFLPIRVMSLVGVAIAVIGLGLSLLILVRKLFFGTEVDGWAGIMVAILVMGGVQILMLGVIGEYIWRSLAEARGRDEYVIEYSSDEGPAPDINR